MTVLIIEDDPRLRRALAHGLRALTGWQVLQADGPLTAVALYEQADVVLSDWLMPDGGGARVLAECSRPVVILTSEERIEHPHYLLKPASIAGVVEALRRAHAGARRAPRCELETAADA